ncbi:MAG: lactonase family protein [Planctomycetaceae bacterium]
MNPRHFRIDRSRRRWSLVFGLIMLVFSTHATADEPIVLVSSFAGGDDGGISAFKLDTEHRLNLVHKTKGIPNPFFFDVAPDRKFLYSIYAETFGGEKTEQVAAYALSLPDGRLKELNRQTTHGTASCFVEVDRNGKALLVANYSSGSVISYGLQSDGRLSEPVTFVQHSGGSVNEARQKEPHAHCFVISPDSRFAFAADLGIDQVVSYSLDPVSAKLTPARQPFARTMPGAGPRHAIFHPDGRKFYVINELLNSVTFFEYIASDGFLIEKQTISTLPADFKGESYCADLKITPNGRYLYGTNRGHDSLAMYSIADDGQLTLLGIEPSHGKGPQNLAITKDGKTLLCANMPGNNVATFEIREDGRLNLVGTPIEVVSPSCIRILE